jgi:hypothetical protein
MVQLCKQVLANAAVLAVVHAHPVKVLEQPADKAMPFKIVPPIREVQLFLL